MLWGFCYRLLPYNAADRLCVYVCQCQCQSICFSVAKIAELLRSPQRRSRVTIQNQETIVEKEMCVRIIHAITLYPNDL